MIAFDQYFEERFSLNPRKWFTPKVKAIIDQEDLKLRSNARKAAIKYIPILKNTLKQRGYTIHKGDFAYTVRPARKLGISKSDSRDNLGIVDPVINIPYMKTLFTLAHEVGHVLQWNDETNTKLNFQEFLDKEQSAKQIHPKLEEEVQHIHKLWYELDAWVKGMQFIPVEFKPQYKKYAHRCYMSYMHKHPKYYNSEMLLRNLLYQLNFDNHDNI